MWNQQNRISQQKMDSTSLRQNSKINNSIFINLLQLVLCILIIMRYFDIQGNFLGKNFQLCLILLIFVYLLYYIKNPILEFYNLIKKIILAIFNYIQNIFDAIFAKSSKQGQMEKYFVEDIYQAQQMEIQNHIKSQIQSKQSYSIVNRKLENKSMKVPQPEEMYQNQSFPIIQQRQKTSMKQESPVKRKKSISFNIENSKQSKFQNEYHQTIKDLNIENFIDKWEINSQKFIFNELIPEALSGLKQALWKCNSVLNMHFRKSLIEYHFFSKDDKNEAKISMNDLIFYHQNLNSKGGVFWKIYSTDNSKDVEEIHHELSIYISLLLSFDHLFMINGFEKTQIYSYVIQRLLNLSQNSQNFEYGNNNLKYPSDSQIIFHLFIIFLNQIQINNTKVKSFIKEKGQMTRKGEILFEQLEDDGQQYVNVNFMKEQWFPKPGKDNIISAISLFFYGLKYRLQDYEKRDFKPEINRKIDQIVPKNKF